MNLTVIQQYYFHILKSDERCDQILVDRIVRVRDSHVFFRGL